MAASPYVRRGDGAGGRRRSVVAGLIAPGLMHLLLLSTPRPWRFFSWIAALLTLIAVIPFVTNADLEAKVATALINMVIGIAIGSLIPAVARGASRHDRGQPTGI